MNITIKEIKDRGNIDKERAVFVVQSDCELGSFFAFKTQKTKVEEQISSDIKHPFWFPDQEVKKNDIIVLYTKAGIDKQKQNSDSTITYFYYMEEKNSIFGNDEDRILLVHSDSWSIK